MERPAAVLAAIYLAFIVNRVAGQLKGGLPPASRASNCRHILVFLYSCIHVFLSSHPESSSCSVSARQRRNATRMTVSSCERYSRPRAPMFDV